jgi:hypothetical protein
LVVISAGPGVQKTEEEVTPRSNDNSHVSTPYHQIPGLRMRDSLKAFDAGIKIRGVGISVGKSGPFINGMNQVRAIMCRRGSRFGIERGGQQSHAIVVS